MRFFLPLVTITQWLTFANAQTGTYSTCPTYAFLTTRGCCDPRLTSYITPISTAVMSQLSGGIHYETDYDADYAKTSLLAEAVSLPLAVAYITLGSIALTNYTIALTQNCPDTKIAMLAYSEGSFVQLLAHNNPLFPLDRVNVNVLWGNMFWAPGRSEDAGTATSGQSAFGLYGLDPLKTPEALVSKTQDYCLYGDNICTGTDVDDAHHHYITDPWLTTTANYIVQQLKAAGVPAA